MQRFNILAVQHITSTEIQKSHSKIPKFHVSCTWFKRANGVTREPTKISLIARLIIKMFPTRLSFLSQIMASMTRLFPNTVVTMTNIPNPIIKEFNSCETAPVMLRLSLSIEHRFIPKELVSKDVFVSFSFSIITFYQSMT
jgi:hypothetical protein